MTRTASDMVKIYYNLTKPGVVYGNVLTTVAAYLYASRWGLMSPDAWAAFLAAIVGIGLVIASACVFNNFIDRDIDRNMRRTKARALPSGALSSENAILFGAALCLVGFTLLLAFVNVAATFAALVGFLVYVFVYTFAKRKTAWATEVGSVAGAAPIVVGYAAAVGHFDWAALILFLALVCWQMPHFYAIAIYRLNDYALADLPVLPITNGTRETKLRALLYIVLFALAVFALTFFGFAGYWYLVVVEIATLAWFWYATRGFEAQDSEAWARKFFFFSLAILVVFSVMLSVASILP